MQHSTVTTIGTRIMQGAGVYSRVEAAAYAAEEVLGVAGVSEKPVDERGPVAGGEPRYVDLAERVVTLDGRVTAASTGRRRPEQPPSRAGDGGEPLQRRPPQRLPLVLRLTPRSGPRERGLRRPHRRAAARAQQTLAAGRGPPPLLRRPSVCVGGAALRGILRRVVLADGGNGGGGREGGRGWIHRLARIYGARGHGRLLSLSPRLIARWPGFALRLT